MDVFRNWALREIEVVPSTSEPPCSPAHASFVDGCCVACGKHVDVIANEILSRMEKHTIAAETAAKRAAEAVERDAAAKPYAQRARENAMKAAAAYAAAVFLYRK